MRQRSGFGSLGNVNPWTGVAAPPGFMYVPDGYGEQFMGYVLVPDPNYAPPQPTLIAPTSPTAAPPAPVSPTAASPAQMSPAKSASSPMPTAPGAPLVSYANASGLTDFDVQSAQFPTWVAAHASADAAPAKSSWPLLAGLAALLTLGN